jgi:hypothetical protein
MNDLTAVQVMFLVMFVIGSLALVVTAVSVILILVRVSASLEVARAVLRVSAANNVDTREKVDRVAALPELVRDEVKRVNIKVEEVKQTVAQVVTSPGPEWKPGDPEPRGKDLGPQARGMGPLGWLIAPTIALLGLLGHATAIQFATQEEPTTVNIEAGNERLRTAGNLMSRREFDRAAEEFTRALQAGADDEVCLARRAECRYYSGDRTAVLEDAERLEGRRPQSPWPSYLRGLVYKRGGDTRAAREEFHRAALLGHPQAPAQLRITDVP